jgi:hypothetical protein
MQVSYNNTEIIIEEEVEDGKGEEQWDTQV